MHDDWQTHRDCPRDKAETMKHPHAFLPLAKLCALSERLTRPKPCARTQPVQHKYLSAMT